MTRRRAPRQGGAINETGEEVVLEIDYAIIRHFSQHLYGSPNKAVEELVANGFDAFATKVFVYVPGAHTAQSVVVWDNGTYMDIEGLKALWWIARSPKAVGDRIETRDERTRKLIGKFGIGKLASYAVGNRISHLCKTDGRFLLVGIDYQSVQQTLPTEGTPGRYATAILDMDEEAARAWVADRLDESALAHECWDAPTFTLACIEELHEVALTPGRLAWVLGNAMPLRPDFRVWVEDAEVATRLGRGATTTWDLQEDVVRAAIQSAWREARTAGHVAGEIDFDVAAPAIRLPALSDVTGTVSLFATSLQRAGETRDERSYGFFVMVRDRLLNVDDEKLFLADPSFGTFYRSQYVIHADGLDANVLADRGRLKEDVRTRELAVLQRGMYLAARQELTRQDEEATAIREYLTLLPTTNRELFREPLTALLLTREDGGAPFDPSEARVLRAEWGAAEPLARVAVDQSAFQVNTEHPLFVSLQRALGTSRAAERALRAFEALAVTDVLLEGFLIDIGVDDSRVSRIVGWRDSVMRAIAARYESTPAEVIAEVHNASYAGDARFEHALAELFSVMGFVARRVGAAGNEDVLVIGPTGRTASRFTIEGKGSRHPLENDAAEIAGAARHALAAEAPLAVVVTREFAGMTRGDMAAVIGECVAVSNDRVKVSVADVGTLIELVKAVERFSYPLEVIYRVLAEIETPDAKRQRIETLVSPVDQFDYRGLLDQIWERQQDEAEGDAVPYRAVWQRLYRESVPDFDTFAAKLVALETLAKGLIRLDTDRSETITLLQSPERIAEQIRRSLEAVQAE